MGKEIPKPKDRSAERDKLDALTNAESQRMIDEMQRHLEINMEDRGGKLNGMEVMEIHLGYLVQQIAGLKVLLRGEVLKSEIEYQEAQTVEEAKGIVVPGPKGGEA